MTYIVRVLCLICCLAFTFHLVDVTSVSAYLQSVPVSMISLLVGLGVIRNWLTGVRWRIVNPDPTNQLSTGDYFRLVMICGAFNLIMPGVHGGDLAKATMAVSAVRSHRVDNVVGILVDRFIGLASIILLGALSMSFMTRIPGRIQFALSFVLLGTGMLMLVIMVSSNRLLSGLQTVLRRLNRIGPRLSRMLNAWQEAMQCLKRDWKRVLRALALCIPIHGVSFVTVYILARSLQIPVTFFDMSMVLALVWVITAFPISISGVGVRELSMIYFLGLYGVAPESATALSVLYYTVIILLGVVGAFFILDRRPLARRATEPT